MDNTVGDFEHKITNDAVHAHVSALKRHLNLPVTSTTLLEPRPAPAQMTSDVQRVFNCYGHEVLFSNDVVCPPLRKFQRGDVALGREDAQLFVCEIFGHASIVGVCITFISKWISLGNDVFEIADRAEMIPTEFLIDTCIFKRMGTRAIVLKPVHQDL
eukprot:1570723-Karenia_brevis.AAC.1